MGCREHTLENLQAGLVLADSRPYLEKPGSEFQKFVIILVKLCSLATPEGPQVDP